MAKSASQESKSPSRLIDEKITELDDWRGEMLSVKFTLAKGAALKDPAGLFNSSLEGNIRRAIDFHEGEKINEKAFKTLIRAAVTLNKSKA